MHTCISSSNQFWSIVEDYLLPCHETLQVLNPRLERSLYLRPIQPLDNMRQHPTLILPVRDLDRPQPVIVISFSDLVHSFTIQLPGRKSTLGRVVAPPDDPSWLLLCRVGGIELGDDQVRRVQLLRRHNILYRRCGGSIHVGMECEPRSKL